MSDLWDVYIVEYAVSHEPWVDLISGMHDEAMIDLSISFVLARRSRRAQCSS